jgi:exonuclease SbcC
MSIKIAHISDLHCCREHAEEALASLRFFAAQIKTSPVDMVAIAGDVWDASMLNTEASGFTRFVEAIRDIADLAPVAIVYGTPSHDTDGSLEIFRNITSKYGITILDPGQAYFLAPTSGGIFPESEANRLFDKNNRLAIILGIPEPRKKYLLADTSAGKDETEEAIREAMHKMCFLLAAKRQDYSSMPCIVLYHGEVAGTVYQNDQAIERGTGIAITIDDLTDIGADYYALGHIHKPQQVGNINAYYAGSIYPKNFGETHQASFKIVDVESTIENERLTSVNTVDFPHPQNLKIEARFEKGGDDNRFLIPKELSGFRVWLEIHCDRENRPLLDVERQHRYLLEHGAAKDSRVTLSEIPVETVRAAEITAVNTPEKKFGIWAENSAVEFMDSHLTKIKSLDAEIAQGAAKADGEWELVSLRLKGAIGIMKGIKKEEIAVNFDNFDSGIIALIGANGKGKTTLIENCHPYPQLLTRKGKLQDHFFLRDGFREVIYRNCLTGIMTKFLIQIDGQNKSGSCKYFIFKQAAGLTDTEWEPLPGVDGNLKPYEEALEATFGPIELFQRTAFITQRPTKNLPDLTDATAGEKKALFVALAGIDYLQGFADTAAEKAKLEAAKAHDAEIKGQVLAAAIEKKPQEEQSFKDSEATLTTMKDQLVKVTNQGKAVKADIEDLQAAWNAEQTRQRQENEAKAAVDTTGSEIRNLTLDIDILTEAAENKPRYEKDVAEYKAQRKVIDAENAKKQIHTEVNLKKQQDYAKVKAAYDEGIKAVEVERDNLGGQRNAIERLVANAESNIRLAEKDEEVDRNRLCKPLADRKSEIDHQILTAKNHIELYERDAAEITEDCPTCGQKLPENKLAELKKKREEYIQKIASEKTGIETLNAEITDIEKKLCEAIQQAAEQREEKIAKEKAEIEKQNNSLAEINKRIEELNQQVSELAFDEPETPEIKPFDDTALKAALAKQQRIDIAQTRAALAQAQEAAVRIDGLKKQVAEKTKLLKDKEAEYAKIRQSPEVGVKIKADLDTVIARHTELSEQYTAVKEGIARTEANIMAVRKTLAEIVEKEKEYSELNTVIQGAAREGQEWELIARAFGRDGIQALELDALAPGISDTANRILESAYGDRFKIVIETTRMGGAGKKTKQIEDFVIKVIDSEDGEAVNLDDKSGGEAVWVKRAIYDAFAVIRKRNTNFAFLSCFQDEADGALDSAAKTAYCRMLEAAHAESKLRHTFIITHSNEVKAMIDQKIDMEELAAAV